jgi:hypothetical protein
MKHLGNPSWKSMKTKLTGSGNIVNWTQEMVAWKRDNGLSDRVAYQHIRAYCLDEEPMKNLRLTITEEQDPYAYNTYTRLMQWPTDEYQSSHISADFVKMFKDFVVEPLKGVRNLIIKWRTKWMEYNQAKCAAIQNGQSEEAYAGVNEWQAVNQLRKRIELTWPSLWSYIEQ